MLSYYSQAQSVSITKRHYTAGYYVDFSSRKKVVSKNEHSSNQNIIAAKSSSINNIPAIKEEAPEQMPLVIVKNISVEREKINKHIAINKIAKISVKLPTTETGNRNNQDNILSSETNFNTSASLRSSNDAGVNLLLIVIITIFIPPLGVALVRGINIEFWLDLILTLLFFIPGLIYGLIVVLS